ncbi:DUF4142 domain-containing protein [Amycolatopsis sp. cmx-11-51]|uniref:DUF4142 domain-containing protein n=1 Tax=unclassified Amycolatopsis TaxID=2618356 RepID=UPI0039E6CC76
MPRRQARELASRIRVELPGEPTEEQRSWADEITGAAFADFDRVYVNRARAAHGSIFGLASQVRAATRDDAMRSFAQTAVDTVMRQMTLLESTGLAETISLTVSPPVAPNGTVATSRSACSWRGSPGERRSVWCGCSVRRAGAHDGVALRGHPGPVAPRQRGAGHRHAFGPVRLRDDVPDAGVGAC